ncbi:hypothetical protein [Leifsonia sp. LS-T14]|uniref:hypothetical protein n=1 Tax=unclassified Leifsonia TaxID=2663824 RepID=UPI0035A66E99
MSERDDLEGRYTQAEPQTAESRKVHGQYSEESGAGPEAGFVGTYVGAERDGSGPMVRSSTQRSGNYPKAEHSKSGEEQATGS